MAEQMREEVGQKQERLLRLNQIIGQPEVTEAEAEANKAEAAAIRKKFPVNHPDREVQDRQKKERKRILDKIGPRFPQKEIEPLIPVSASTWWAGVGTRFPSPVRLGNITCWRASEVLALLKRED